jgi:hypothetical protein
MAMHRWTDPVRQKQIAELSAQGLSARQIAAVIGEDPQAVAAAMSRYGLYARQGSGGRPPRAKRVSLAKVEWTRPD